MCYHHFLDINTDTEVKVCIAISKNTKYVSYEDGDPIACYSLSGLSFFLNIPSRTLALSAAIDGYIGQCPG